MGIFKKTLQRFQRKMDFINNVHEDCANFDNGVCKATPQALNLTNLNPKGPACPHFKARTIEKAENPNK